MLNTAPPAATESPTTTPSVGDRLDDLALRLARSLTLLVQPKNEDPLPARLSTLKLFLQTAYHHFDKTSRTEIIVSHAAEWMLDNFYVIEQTFHQINEGLPANFYKRLPKVGIDGSEMARIYVMALMFTRYNESRLIHEQIVNFIQTFQSTTPLTIGEVWAIPLVLRLSVLETLADALAHITKLEFTSVPLPVLWPKSPDDQIKIPEIDDETIVVNSIVSLRLLATQDWKTFFENVSVVERILRSDPAGIYPNMDFETRNRYRNVVEELARGAPVDEVHIARAAIRLATDGQGLRMQHVGHYLIDSGRILLEEHLKFQPPPEDRLRRWLYRHATFAYIGGIALVTALFCLGTAWYAIISSSSTLLIVMAVLLVILPASSIAVDLINGFVAQSMPPRILPRLEFQKGVPREFSTMVVIPCLLTNKVDLQFLLNQLETHFLSNADSHIRFALLTDLSDAPEKEMPGEVDLIKHVKTSIIALNARYKSVHFSPFYFFHRERAWNPSENCWMGWERKRGKLSEFNSLLLGKKETSFIVKTGDMRFLPNIRYVITLDADTTLPRDSARHLIETLAHPLNQAEFDPKTGALSMGYTVLQPRVQVRPTVANRSVFSRTYSGDITLDLYTRAVSDVYQDLFGEGSFVGKGIYEVSAFERSLAGRIPDNTLLSHDLFEGVHGRCGLVSNIVLFEDYPPHYLAYAHRLHRWIRGDWQLLPWLMPRVPHRELGSIPNDLSVLDRWKIFDNLRRSLVNLGILALLISGWFFLPGSNLFWTFIAIVPFGLVIGMRLFARLGASRTDQHGEVSDRSVQQAAQRAFFEIVFLPYEALIALDAISTTLVRVLFTHTRLLEWVTAAHTVNIFGKGLKIRVAWQEMVTAPLLSLAILISAIFHPMILLIAAPFLLLWIFSPYIATKISKEIQYEPERPSALHRHQLHLLARTTWLYFEHFVGPDDHWLPPDHFQEDPRGLVAHRTSPTNVGLLLLSTLSAFDLGYIGHQELVLRLRSTLDGMDQLEKQRGHLLNWYDTHTLVPLPPRYISTVDSGNLAAALLALRQSCADVIDSPIVRWEGLIDTFDVLDETLHNTNLGPAVDELHNVIADMRKQAEGLRAAHQRSPQFLIALFRENRYELEDLLIKVVDASAERLDADTLRRLSIWIERTRHHLSNTQRDLETLYPWALIPPDAPVPFNKGEPRPALETAWSALQATFIFRTPLKDIPAICAHAMEALAHVREVYRQDEHDALLWCDKFADRLKTARDSAQVLLDELQQVAARAEACFVGMNFNFLFNSQRQVFHIGYNVDSGRLDPNFYDLLASEARLTSLLAIAKGDIPQSHWLYLARPITQIDGRRTLLSWSGTMFEYLMPALLARSYRGTLLDQSCHAAVHHQVEYGQAKKVPWGISESSFYYFDASQVYQYRAFGAPGLGYKRGLADDLVVTPYASLLALPFAPLAVVQNLERLQKLNMLGIYGLYEAIDFTEERLSAGQDYAIVRSYMAHHQGMIMLALCNYLRDDIMIRRFHADARIETVQLLLQEQTPSRAPIEHPHPHEVGVIHPVHSAVALEAWGAKAGLPYPQLHFLSNGDYSLLISSSGSGYSHWRTIALTRWRADTTLDNYGTWLYVQDRSNRQRWSASFQPTASTPMNQEVRFYPHTVEFLRRDGDISMRTRITVAPESDVEVRRVILTNHSNTQHQLTLTSYGEIALSPQSVDQRHPAFNKLFVESEFMNDGNVLLFRRRPRSASEKPVFLAHFATNEQNNLQVVSYETDRARFLGRGGTARTPAALQGRTNRLSNTTGATLDPIFALQVDVVVPPFETIQLAFVTLVSASRKDALALARRFRRWQRLVRTVEESRLQLEKEMVQINLTSKQLEQIQKLLSVLLYPNPALRADPSTLATNTLSQPGLWPFAISGDYPILLIYIKDDKDLDLLNELLQAHTYWRRHGLMIDLVILNRIEASYMQDFQTRIYRLLTRTSSENWINQRGGIFTLREDQLSEAEHILLKTAARAILNGEAGPLAQQLEKLDRLPVRLPHFVSILPPLPEAASTAPVERPAHLLFDNGVGGFTPDGREYIVYLDRDQWTPLPWSNIIANPGFGFLVTESGLGCTWAENSGENRLTPWRNDPVGDPPSEAVYLRDEDTGQLWSPTPLPARANAPYLIHHGIGYSIFEHNSHELNQQLKIFAVTDAPVKIVQLKLKNTTQRTRRINVTYYAEWVLGTTHEDMAQYIVPEFASNCFALLAHNPYNLDFNQRVAFLAATRELHGVTTDRTEFLGQLGNYACPAALERVGLTATAKPGVDPCAAMQLLLWLEPGETKEVTFLLGQGQDRENALQSIKRYQDVSNIKAAWESIGQFWEDRLGGIQVKTPDPAMDVLLNHWLPYESLACRIWGRTAFYQSGGAFGYRDQLQDVLAFLATQPEIAREHILLAARHQFEQGDVLHWWHPPAGRGLRTRITDNMLWLPYVTAQYIKVTGDRSILSKKIPFLSAEPLKKSENERYGSFRLTDNTETLYEHCRRALAKGTTAGPHGLPLMGTGDWNDGMNNVGAGGVGESVWLGWFLYATLTSFAEICDMLPNKDQGAVYRKQAEELRAALENSAWDGNWYRRAFFDDGKPLGSAENNDCKIDSISQSWAVISGAADPERARTAMESLYQMLVRQEDGLILLLTPPFDRTILDPGYIKGYLPGIRENGGQYTHAALWAIWAFAKLGDGERVNELFRLINPIYHADTREKVERYRTEPYVIAADVYSVAPHNGRGGWTWYTGSASWMFRLGVEMILGLQREGNHLTIRPCISKEWREYEIHYRFGGSIYHICVENQNGVNQGVKQISLDGAALSDGAILLVDDDQTHEIIVTMGE